ncbi:periplasmic Cu(I)/Cu(II)-binding protein CopK [Denitromonas sp.]|uniref:periplasmic Cu(I)/Cu(II)-binding protein CopK n=1 Tax=Denitromonas sp. TaxID=2734609 RepID=UPI002AFF032B|nr:periplasmic Cu(I)/Cu(II)-binding protein CopK [Denitromonas sp.]
MIKKALTIIAISAVSISAFAADAALVEKSIPLKDGATVYIFKDGKMGMEDKFGRATHMQPGHVMETTDGQKIIMNGNEIWRLDALIHKDHRG